MFIICIIYISCVCNDSLYNVWLLQVYSKSKVWFFAALKIIAFFLFDAPIRNMAHFLWVGSKTKKKIMFFLACISFVADENISILEGWGTQPNNFLNRGEKAKRKKSKKNLLKYWAVDTLVGPQMLGQKLKGNMEFNGLEIFVKQA